MAMRPKTTFELRRSWSPDAGGGRQRRPGFRHAVPPSLIHAGSAAGSEVNKANQEITWFTQ